MEISPRFDMSPDNFNYLRQQISEYAGIDLNENKYEMIYSRLAKRLRTLNLKSFDDYCQLLREGHQEEIIAFVNALTTNLTGFFREPHHFKYIKEIFVSELLQQHPQLKLIQAWSAGCASGEEAYSLAIALENGLQDTNCQYRLMASDIDTGVLEVARNGIYPEESIEMLSWHEKHAWFLRGTGPNKNLVKVKPELSQKIIFKTLNLVKPWPPQERYHVIFCRNVLIYFNRATQAKIINLFADQLTDDGVLVVGHSESLFKMTDRFSHIAKTIYRKIS